MWLYRTYIPVLMGLSRLIYGVKTDKSAIKNEQGPFLVLGNHTSPIDFLFFTACIYPEPLNYVVAQNMNYTKVYGAYIRRFGAISKKQFAADISCIKNIKRNLDNGTSVLLFPEGRVSIDGTTGFISPTIGKLIKWLGYPVVAGITKGGYTSNPKWGRKRSAGIELSVKVILTRDEIAKMSQKEIADKVTSSLNYDDNKRLVASGGKIKGKRLAEGIEKILYKCPVCGEEFRITSKGNTFRCNACGSEFGYSDEGKLTGDAPFGYISDWYAYERENIKKLVEDEDFCLSAKVVCSINNDKIKRFSDIGEGILTVSKDGIRYEGESGEYRNLYFKLENRDTIAFKMGENLEVSDDDNIFRFTFTEGLYSTKFVLAIEELHKKYFG